MKSSKEAILAYYVSKWYVNGLKISERDLLNTISEKMDLKRFKALKKDFGHILSEDDLSEKNVSVGSLEAHLELKNKTVTQIRTKIKEILNKLHMVNIECDLNVKFNNPYENGMAASEAIAKADFSKCDYTMEEAYRAGFIRIVKI